MKTPRTVAPSRITAFTLGLASAVLLPSIALGQTTGFNQTGAGPFNYTDTANWVGGNINGIWDSSLTLTATQATTFAADTVLSTGLTFNYVGGFGETLRGSGGNFTLTLGGDIIHNTNGNVTVNFGASTGSSLNVDLGGQTRTFTVGSGKTLGFVNTISNGGLIVSGGTVNFSGTNTYTGSTTLISGTLSLNGSTGSSASSDFSINGGGASTSTLTFNSGTNGNPGTTRAKSVTLNGAGSSAGVVLTASGNGTANSTEVITNALTASEGFSTISVGANAAKNARLSAGSFSREAGSTVLIRGTNLGLNTIASQTAGSANISFTAAPTLSGSGSAGSSTVGIIKGAYGAITTGSNGTGLVTYDTANGVRLLNAATEYTAAISNGQTQLDNVLYTRASGGASQDLNLTAATTTINSLSFNITGAGTNSGVTISGDAGTTLKIASGMIFASQTVTTAAASDAMIISAPTLDLNGQEGVIIVFTNSVSNGNTAAPLQINSAITNDGGNGVTIGGTGQVIFGGSSANTYTGPTTLNSGILRLSKTTVNSLTSDLVMNGGLLLKTSNTIADTASVTINGGTFTFDSTTSSGNNNHQETINNFTMNGGSVSNHGTGASFTINGNATLNAGNLIMNQGGDITVAGITTLNGGLLTAKDSTSTTVFNGLTSLNAVNITNTASGAYTAIALTSNATNKGAQLTLNGDITFTGNGTNTNTVRIASTDGSLANQGVFRLEGTRTFTIGNGAADADLTVEVALVNGTAAGGLIKSGAGTLALSGGNTYSGNTVVNGGALTLADTGSLTFYIGANGVNNSVTGSGTVTFSGSFNFDLTNAVATGGNSWLIVDTGTLSESFTGSFAVAGFTENSNIWTNGAGYSFNEATGILSYSAVPEPSTFALLGGAAVLLLAALRRRRTAP